MIGRQPIICVVGPTATGKSEVGQRIARALHGEVLSADSMQIYRGMDIGTGKLPPSQRIVPHYGLDLVDPGTPYSVSLYQDYGRRCIDAMAQQNCQPVVVGGTGFYVKALIDDYVFPSGDQVGNAVRDKYTALAEREGAQALWELLKEKDPESAEVIHPHNVRRVIRAFEMLELEHTSYASQLKNLQTLKPYAPSIQIGLAVQPDILNDRINRRVDAMIEEGLVDEVTDLLNRGFREGITAQQAIGYKEIVSVLDGNGTLDEAIADIKQATRRYAKRQRTWFRRDSRIIWINADSESPASLCDQACGIIEPMLKPEKEA